MSTEQSKRVDRLFTIQEETDNLDKSRCSEDTRSCSSSHKSQPSSPDTLYRCVSVARYLHVKLINKLTRSEWKRNRPEQTGWRSRPSRHQKRPTQRHSPSLTAQSHASNRSTDAQSSTAASGSVTPSAQHTVFGAVWSGLSNFGKALLPGEQGDGEADTVNSQFRDGTEGDRK